MRKRLERFLDAEVDGRAIGIARIILGIAALLKGAIIFRLLVDFQETDPLRFPYPLLGISLPSGTFASAVILIWLVSAILFTLGLATRVAGALIAIAIFLTIGIDQQFYSNHLYLMGTVVALMTIAGPGARYSVDARFGRAGPTVPGWAATLIMLQLTSVYFFAAVSKLNREFLSGDVIRAAFEPDMRVQVEEFVSLEVLAFAAVGTELLLAFAFWSRRGREFALPVGVAFHAANVFLMGRGGSVNLTIFALVMLAMMLVFFSERIPETSELETDEPRPEDPVAAAHDQRVASA